MNPVRILHAIQCQPENEIIGSHKLIAEEIYDFTLVSRIHPQYNGHQRYCAINAGDFEQAIDQPLSVMVSLEFIADLIQRVILKEI